jgi:histidinol-phosphate aminotransferase
MASDLVCSCVRRITPYSPGKLSQEVMEELGIAEVIKLASNENPLGPAPLAVEAMRDALGEVHVYPDPVCRELTAALAAKLNVCADSIVVGRGSDEVIHMTGLAFVNPGEEIVYSAMPFALYPMTAHLCDAVGKEVPSRGFEHDLRAMAAAITERTKLVILGNPCNPTGTICRKAEVEWLMDRVPEHAIVMFDEAYYEYVDDPAYPDCLEYVREGRNVLVMRTFSKAYGLAGLRIGYGMAGPGVAEGLKLVRAPFNVATLAQVAALAALSDEAHLRASIDLVHEGRQYLYDEFAAMGLQYVPTQANFILVDTRLDSRAVFDGLMRRGITVRTGDIFGLPTHIRVSFGTMPQNRRFVSALREVLGQT